jgi:hypothetical protein
VSAAERRSHDGAQQPSISDGFADKVGAERLLLGGAALPAARTDGLRSTHAPRVTA